MIFVEDIPLYVPEASPDIVTFADVLCIPWFGQCIVIVVEPLVVEIGFVLGNNLVGSSSFTRLTVPIVLVVNEQAFNLNLTSSFCSLLQVEPFWDLNILPRYGCFEISLEPSRVVCPILAV